MNLKNIAREFLENAANGRVDIAFSHTTPSFIHHNSHFEGDQTSLKEAMIRAHEDSPNLSFEIKRLIAEERLVVAHSRVVKENMEIAVVHILRFEHDKIVELWDVANVIENFSPNKNSPF